MFSFEEKVMALSSIKAIGFPQTVNVFSRLKKSPPVTTRGVLQKLETSHFLIKDGLVELTDSGVLLFVHINCPHQPTTLTKEYYQSCNQEQQEEFAKALTHLEAIRQLKSLKFFKTSNTAEEYLGAPTPNVETTEPVAVDTQH